MATEALNRVDRLFRARMQDGSSVTYKANWQSYADIDSWEDGKPWTWDHPFDDRRCHWNISGRIVRRVAVVIAGQEYWDDKITQVFNQAHPGEGSSFQLSQLRPENCNDCQQKRDSDYSNMRNAVNDALNNVADNDLPAIMQAIKGRPDIVEVNIA